MFLFGALTWVIWLPALWVTRELVLESGCGVEKIFFIKWLCDSYGIFAIEVITPIFRVFAISMVLVVAAFLQGSFFQGLLFKHKSLRNWDTPFISLVLGVALINSIHDVFVYMDTVESITIGLLTFYAGIPLLAIMIGSIYLKYYWETKRVATSLMGIFSSRKRYRVYVDATISNMQDSALTRETLIGYVVEGLELRGVKNIEANETDEAELSAILFAMDELKGKLKQFVIFCDHKSVVSEINREPRNAKMKKPLYQKVRTQLLTNPTIQVEWFKTNPAHKHLKQYLVDKAQNHV